MRPRKIPVRALSSIFAICARAIMPVNQNDGYHAKFDVVLLSVEILNFPMSIKMMETDRPPPQGLFVEHAA
jgi:hypothetical protein